MLSNLGLKRILVLLVFFSLNGLLAVYFYAYLSPERFKVDRGLRVMQEATTERKETLSQMQVQFDILEKQIRDFETIKASGFFQQQNRRKAELVLEEIQKITNIINAKVSIGPAKFVEDSGISEHFLLESPLELDLEALSDGDIFKYIYLLENHFPGHLTIKEITMNREKNIDGPVLRSIASGNKIVVVSANIKIVWQTMTTKNYDEESL